MENKTPFTYINGAKRRQLGGSLSVNGKLYRIYSGVNQVGRNKEAFVNIKSLGVSQHHALFTIVNNDLHFISDLNSSNGTFLDNKKLEPYALYPLNDGSSIRFADLEGVYSKCKLQEVEPQDLSNISDNTQNFTQTFYGGDTQVIDNTFKHPENPDRNYVSSQILAEVADRLEDSINEIHESPTQVINVEEIKKNFTVIDGPSTANSCEESNHDVHEADTQVIVIDDNKPGHSESTESAGTEDDATDHHEAETQKLEIENVLEDPSEVEELEVSNEIIYENVRLLCSDPGLREESPVASTSGLQNQAVLSQEEEDVIKPVGLSRNVLNDSMDSTLDGSDFEAVKPPGKTSNLLTSQEENCETVIKPVSLSRIVLNDSLSGTLDESDCEVIKPLGKTSNVFITQEENGTVSDKPEAHENGEFQTEIADNNEDVSGLDESQCDVIKSTKKAWNLFESQTSGDSEEDSNDSVDFMTMQKIPSTQKYLEDSPDKQSNKEEGKSCELFEKSSSSAYLVDDVQSTDAEETDVEDNDAKSKEKIERRKSEGLNNDKIAASVCSESETDDENEIADKNKTVGVILEESTLEDNKKSGTSTNRQSTGLNDLNDSDFIPATPNTQPKSISQNSKFDSSENSFKLGLTQLMEESDVSQTNEHIIEERNGTEKEEAVNKSQTSQGSEKKFTFKRSLVGVTKSIDLTLDVDEDIDGAQTEVMFEDIDDSSKTVEEKMDEEVFLRPTQEAPKKTKKIEDNATQDEIYMMPTQKFDGASATGSSDDIYQQSTQKFVESDGSDPKCSRLSDNEFYQLPTQKIPESEKTPEKNCANRENLDDLDIFATQAMITESPSKRLESELENMFATQRVLPADDTLDEIQDIITERGLSNDKLPSEDKDLEAILCTQRMTETEVNQPEKSVESQLEVIFTSQVSNLPPDKFVRPANPLVNILGVESQNLEDPSEIETNSFDKSPKNEDLSSTTKQKNDTLDKSDKECDISKSKQKSLVGLEQSFALLEASSSKIRRSKRKNDSEDISVSCPKTRAPVVVAPNDEEPEPVKNARSSRKRKPPASLENYVTDKKEPRRSKRRRFSESSNTSDEDNEPDISSKSIKNYSKLSKIQEENENIKTPKKAETVVDKRSTRIQEKKKTNEDDNEENEPYTLSKENIKNKRMSRIQEDEDVDRPKRPGTPSAKRSSRLKIKKDLDDESDEEIKPSSSSSLNDDQEVDPPERSETPSEKNSRARKNREQNKENDKFEEAEELATYSKDDIKNKLLNKIQEDINYKTTKRPETPTKKRSSRMLTKEKEQKCDNDNKTRSKTKTKTETEQNIAIEDKINESKDSDEASVDSGIEGSDKKRGKNKEEPKMARSKGSKQNKNKDEESLTNESHTKEATKRGRRKKEETKTAESTEEVKNGSMDQSKEEFENSDNHSRSSKRGCSIQVTTPSKIRKVSEATPSTSRRMDMQDTPSRSKRKLKPKVVFTMLDNPQLESQIKQLGGSIVDSVDASTVLLTKFVKRSMKLLSAVGLSKPICSEDWVKQSKKENSFLDPWDFILVDKEAEKKWNFSLKTSLERSSQAKLFEGYTFQLLVTNALDVLKGAIESCGGKTVTRRPKEATKFVVVATAEQRDKYKKIVKQHSDAIVVEPEAIFDGVLRQEIRFERHLLK